MREQEFIGRLNRLGGFGSKDEAMKVLSATAATMWERLPDGQMECLAAALPAGIAAAFEKPAGTRGESFSVEEFMSRVSRRAEEPMQQTVRHVRAVAEVIQEAVPAEVMNEVYATLPYDIRQLFYAR